MSRVALCAGERAGVVDCEADRVLHDALEKQLPWPHKASCAVEWSERRMPTTQDRKFVLKGRSSV